MIDERHQELASLYAFDLLEGVERADFETALAREPKLQALVIEMRETSAALAHTAPSTLPPPALKQRVLASVVDLSKRSAPAEKIIRPSFRAWNLIPWAIAACLAAGAGWLGKRYTATQSEAVALRDQNALVNIALQSTRQQIEAEQITTRRQREEVQQQLANLNSQLSDAGVRLTERDREIADARNQLADRARQLEDRERQLAETRLQLSSREGEVATLTQRIDVLANASAEVSGQLGRARQQVANLTAELKSQVDLANLKITTLASMLKNSPRALAVAVWDPRQQEGVLNVQNLPALAANEDYQLWVVDPQYPNPVDGGVFTVEPSGGRARVQFKTNQPIETVNAFAVTRERKGGVPKAQGPFVLLGK
ncbi:MAG: anti-sigma factor domain-containing protein [Gammaproteobacteria bacterium]